MIRSTVAHVDLTALQANFRAIQQFLGASGAGAGAALRTNGSGPGIIAVVKANAYGHGAERVALALEQAGASVLACADIEEGIVLRRAGVPVIVTAGAIESFNVRNVKQHAGNAVAYGLAWDEALRAVTLAPASRASRASL